MTPQDLDFIQVLLEDKYINSKAANGIHVKTKQKGQIRKRMCNDNRDTFIATLHNVLVAPDLCSRLFSIIMIINSEHHYLFHKGFGPV